MASIGDCGSLPSGLPAMPIAGDRVFRLIASIAVRLLALRVRVALLVLCGILPLLVWQLGSIYSDYRQNRTQADQRELAVARDVALAIEGQLRMRVAVLQ